MSRDLTRREYRILEADGLTTNGTVAEWKASLDAAWHIIENPDPFTPRDHTQAERVARTALDLLADRLEAWQAYLNAHGDAPLEGTGARSDAMPDHLFRACETRSVEPGRSEPDPDGSLWDRIRTWLADSIRQLFTMETL